MDLSFPENCGAFRNEDIESCKRCHSSRIDTVESVQLQEIENTNDTHLKEIKSLEANGRITVSVPETDLNPGQPFTQKLTFNGSQIMYVYGYCRYGESLKNLDIKLIPNPSNRFYLEKHDGYSLPVLDEPGDYIFVLKLLHSRKVDFHKRSRWEEVVLIWTLSVSEETDG